MKNIIVIASLLVGVVGALGAPKGGMPQLDTNMMQALVAMMAANSNTVPLADFRELKALLPAEVSGLKRKSASAEKNTVMGLAVAHAEAVYSAASGGSVEIKITDLGGMGGMMALAETGWASAEVDKETESGYEKTTRIQGCKALEKFDNQGQRGEIQIMVASRFTVSVNGSGVDMAVLQDAVAKIDLKKLAALKSQKAVPAKE